MGKTKSFEMRFDLGTLDSGERSLPFRLLVIFQILMAFENKNELSVNGQVISNGCYASAVKLSSLIWRN